MLRKIDCVMIRVADVPAAAAFYAETFGMKWLWEDDNTVGMGFADTDAEIVLHNSTDIPHDVEVHYLVDNVSDAVRGYEEKGCTILVQPFDIAIGQCAVIQDPFGTMMCILDMTKGARATNAGGN
jgi:lactoylglutathione lyase